MFARIAIFEVAPASTDQVAAYFREYAVQQFLACKGFLGYQCLHDFRAGKLVGISRWSALNDLQASASIAAQVLAGAKALGAVQIGEPQILEELFDTYAAVASVANAQ